MLWSDLRVTAKYDLILSKLLFMYEQMLCDRIAPECIMSVLGGLGGGGVVGKFLVF